MKIEKLPSGSYRIRKMVDGIQYKVIVTDHKPSKREAELLIEEEIAKYSGRNPKQAKNNMTFEEAALKYFQISDDSVTTIKNYNSILKNLSDDFKSTRMVLINSMCIQGEIKKYKEYVNPKTGRKRSAKTIRNAASFITVICTFCDPFFQAKLSLPEKEVKQVYIPEDEQVKLVANEIRGSKYEVAIILASFGMRRSEICGLNKDTDINGNYLLIRNVLVQDINNNWILKDTTKTPAGTRTIYVPDYVINRINETGVVYKGHPGSIGRYLSAVEKKLGIEHFSLHKLRHYYASMSHSLGIPDKYIMESGGWKSKETLDRVYQHAQTSKADEMKKFAADYISELIDLS